MPSFQVPVLGSTDGFLSPFPDSLPQLFLRCLPYAFTFAFGLSPSDQLPFVRFSSGSGYSAFCFFLSTLPGFASQRLFRCAISAFASLAFPVLSKPGFPCFLSRFLYSAFCSFPFILPGFAPTAVPPVLPLCFRFRASPALKAFFRPLSLGSDYSAFRAFFSLLPVFPWRRFPRCIFPLPFSLLPCRPSDSGTQLSAIPFSGRCFASQWLLQRLGHDGRFPLAYALGAGYSAI